MNKQDKPVRDAFTFSLRGATTIASFAAAPAIAHNLINKRLDERFHQPDGDRGPKSKFDIAVRKRPAQDMRA
jgi:hypothetical protein